MAEESLEHRLNEMSRVRKLREKAGKPSQMEINSVMQKVFPVLRPKMVETYAGDKEKAFKELSEYKLANEQRLNCPLSRPELCASFLLVNFGDAYGKTAEHAFDQGNISLFRFFFDFSLGIKLTSACIMSAQDEAAGAMDDIDSKVVSHTGKTFDLSAGTEADYYLYMKREEARSLRFLHNDPSGFSLMDDSVIRIEAESFPGIISSQPKEYILAGAEITRDLYKQLYEITAPLYPPKQQK